MAHYSQNSCVLFLIDNQMITISPKHSQPFNERSFAVQRIKIRPLPLWESSCMSLWKSCFKPIITRNRPSLFHTSSWDTSWNLTRLLTLNFKWLGPLPFTGNFSSSHSWIEGLLYARHYMTAFGIQWQEETILSLKGEVRLLDMPVLGQGVIRAVIDLGRGSEHLRPGKGTHQGSQRSRSWWERQTSPEGGGGGWGLDLSPASGTGWLGEAGGGWGKAQPSSAVQTPFVFSVNIPEGHQIGVLLRENRPCPLATKREDFLLFIAESWDFCPPNTGERCYRGYQKAQFIDRSKAF